MGIVGLFKHLLRVRAHPRFFGLELQSPLGACTGQLRYCQKSQTLPRRLGEIGQLLHDVGHLGWSVRPLQMCFLSSNSLHRHAGGRRIPILHISQFEVIPLFHPSIIPYSAFYSVPSSPRSLTESRFSLDCPTRASLSSCCSGRQS